MGTPLNWIAFNLFIAIAIALDLRVFHRRPHKIALREAAIASFGWIAVSVYLGSECSISVAPSRPSNSLPAT